MPPRRFKDMSECREEIINYVDSLERGTDDDDPAKRQSSSTQRYQQDVRWFDHWLDENNIESTFDLTMEQANKLGGDLSDEFHGTTPRYRWDRIYAMYDHFVKMRKLDENPLEPWDDSKTNDWGMSKKTEQSKRLGDDEKYAVSQDEVRQMEKHVGRHRIRDQLLIRMLWHTGMRRSEAAGVTVEMLDEDAREVRLPSYVTKNGKARVVAWQPNLDGLMDRWLHAGHREDYLGGNDHDELFIGERGGPLSPASINEIVIRAADKAGINRKMYADANAPEPEDGGAKEANRWLVSSHSIRHGLGTYLVHETDMNIFEVSKYLGHRSVSITEEVYVEHDERAGTEPGHEYGPE